MRLRTTALTASAAGLLLVLSACGDPGSGGGQAEPTGDGTSSAAVVCDPVAGDQLVVLDDDQGLQNADNIIAAVNAETAEANPAVLELLSSVSAALDTDALIGLNKAVDIDRQTSEQAAVEFVETVGLASDDQSVGEGVALSIGTANFSESATLGEIYAAVLGSAGFEVELAAPANREAYYTELVSGNVDVVPEYAATLAEFINTTVNGADAEPVASGDPDATTAALTELGAEVGLVFSDVSAAQDQNAFAVTTEFAEEHGVTTLSELAEACGGLVLAGPAECPERPFCQPGLEETYGLEFAEFRSYDFGLIGDAVRQGEAALGLVLSSDGSLATE